MDVIDSHAYWQHPHFPGRAWDMNDWTVKNLPMAGREDGGTLPGLALQRVGRQALHLHRIQPLRAERIRERDLPAHLRLRGVAGLGRRLRLRLLAPSR